MVAVMDAISMNKKFTLLLRGREVAEELGISRALAYRWMQSGVLPVVRVLGSRSVRVPRAALLAWIDQQTENPGEKKAA
jgi:excisionase family DNA binding protein